MMKLAVDNTKDMTTCTFCEKVKFQNPDVMFFKSEIKPKTICGDCVKEASALIK